MCAVVPDSRPVIARTALVAFVPLLATGCVDDSDEPGATQRTEPTSARESVEESVEVDDTEVDAAEDDSEIPKAHPAFKAHFTDAFYEDLGEENAPFGSDEGFDMLFIWDERRDELGADSTVADVLENDPAEFIEHNEYDSAIAVQSAGFTLLRLTGQIDRPGLRSTIAALDQLLAIFGSDPLWLEQRRDLIAWRE